MAQFTEETFPYEVLLRFGEGDTTKKKLTGAHFQTITQVKRDGLIVSSTIDPPQQLALVAGEEGRLLSEVLGEANLANIADNQILRQQLAAAQAEVAALKLAINDYAQSAQVGQSDDIALL